MIDGAFRKFEGAVRIFLTAFLFSGLCFGLIGKVSADTIRVSAGGEKLIDIVAAAKAGDKIIVEKGVHAGPVEIHQKLTLEGEPGAVIDGGAKGHVVAVYVPDVVVRGLTVRNSGIDWEDLHSGIYLEQDATGALVENNRSEGNLYGIYIHGAQKSLVRGNTIIGRRDLRMNRRGNGVSIWNAPGAQVVGNSIKYGRDGIFVNASRKNVFKDNRFTDTRFAIHYMYANDSEVSGNISVGNHVGYALMFSHRLKVTGNVSQDDRDHGILMNYANNSFISGNLVKHSRGKCVFIYNSNKNTFEKNRFEGCEIGVHFTGSEKVVMTENAFLGNRNQVKYVGTRWLEWSREGRGNFWGDNPAFDLDGDGFADTAYRPNDLVDQVVWRAPLAKVLLTSPAVQVLKFAQSQFPGLHPGGVVDSSPLMKAPEIAYPSVDIQPDQAGVWQE